MDDKYPGVATFFVVLAIIIIANIVVMAVGIPYLPIVLGIAFAGWLGWGLVTLATRKQREG